MDEVIKTVLEGFPMFAGFTLFVFFLWKQNEKLLDVLIVEVRELRNEISQLKEVARDISFPKVDRRN